ncbi:MAG: hypothetical protein Q7R77_02040 [Candidatus Daviesbacteria bacterium]|nr:hypothetical protein [Candidatus Daviesbacteria bacterium]
MKIIVVIFIFLAVAGYYVLQNGIPENIPTEILSTKISRGLAVENVKKLPEVQKYLKNVPNGKVEVDNELEGEYNVHVYEVKNGHTATFNWYRVSIKSGEVRSEFQIPTGTVSGKICYPSEVIPEGTIEAKRLSDGKVFILDYGGSESGEGNIYEFPLENGDYYLRYNVKDKIYGYSTTVCPTGKEETCGDTKMRSLRKAEVKTGTTIPDYDLCDFYYKDSNAPKF